MEGTYYEHDYYGDFTELRIKSYEEAKELVHLLFMVDLEDDEPLDYGGIVYDTVTIRKYSSDGKMFVDRKEHLEYTYERSQESEHKLFKSEIL